VAFEEPLVVVEIAEFLEGLVEILNAGDGVDPEKLFLEGAPEAFNAAVAFGGADEGGPGVHAKEGQLGLEGSEDELTTVVVAQLQARCDGLPNAAEGGQTGLMERDDGLVAIDLEGGVDGRTRWNAESAVRRRRR
jgi:hypothetical protein